AGSSSRYSTLSNRPPSATRLPTWPRRHCSTRPMRRTALLWPLRWRIPPEVRQHIETRRGAKELKPPVRIAFSAFADRQARGPTVTYQGQTGTTDTGTDPAYVPDREVFDAYTHRQIWDLARERLAPAELRRVA